MTRLENLKRSGMMAAIKEGKVDSYNIDEQLVEKPQGKQPESKPAPEKSHDRNGDRSGGGEHKGNNPSQKNNNSPQGQQSQKTAPKTDKPAPKRTTIRKDTIPEEKRNNVITKGFSIDKETAATLAAYVEVLKGAGAMMDNRPITDSSFVRYALIHEFERIEKMNGPAFKEAVEKVLNREPEARTKFTC